MAIPRPFPNEPAEYRAARDALLEAEIALRAQVEEVARLRRQLPLGGALAEDYVFHELVDGAAAPVRLSALFGAKDTLVLYNYMFSPQMERPCTSCTCMLDALDGQAPHLTDRVSLAVIAASPIERVRGFTDARGWNNLRLVSSAGTTWQADYLAERANGSPNPMAYVFVRRDAAIRLSWASELLYTGWDGGDPRHIDSVWPLWNWLDLTPEGRGEGWYPKLQYA